MTASAEYTDLGGGATGAPALTTVDQSPIRQKRQEVEHAVEQSGTNTTATTDTGGGLQRSSLGNGDWIRLSQTSPLTNPGGSNQLYLVFRPVAGGPVSNFFNLNWVELGGV